MRTAAALALFSGILIGISMVSGPSVRPAMAKETTNSVAPILGGNFSGMKMDPFRQRLYLDDPSGESVVVFDTSSNTVVADIVVGRGPNGMDVSADGSELYVAVTVANRLAVVDLDTLTLRASMNISGSPTDVVAGRLGRAYVVSSTQLSVVDTGSLSVVNRVVLSVWDHTECITPDKDVLYVVNQGETPAEGFKYSVVSDNVTLLSEAPWSGIGDNVNNMLVSPDGSRLYIAAGAPYYVQELSVSDWSQVGQLDVGGYADWVGLDNAGGLAIGTSNPYNGASVFNTSTSARIDTFFANDPYYSPMIAELNHNGSIAYLLVGDFGFGPYSLYSVKTNVTDYGSAPVVPILTSQPVRITVAEPGLAPAVQLSGCLVSPTSIVPDGTVQTVTATPGCVIQATLYRSSTVRYVTSLGASSFTFTTCSAASCPAFSATVFRQFNVTVSYSVIGGGSPSQPVMGYFSSGRLSNIVLGLAGRALWADNSFWWTTVTLGGSTASERWVAPTPFGQVTGPEHLVVVYYHQFHVGFSADGPGFVSPSPGWFNSGSVVAISATPRIGHRFTGWTTSTALILISSGSAATTQARINGPGVVTGNFM